MYLHALRLLAVEIAVIGFEIYRSEHNTRHIACIERRCQFVGIYPRRTNDFEWQRVTYANTHITQLAKDARGGIEICCLSLRDMR